MHLFYTPDIEGEFYTLNPEESKHCIKVLRLTEGEAISIIDGKGTFYNCVIVKADAKGCGVECVEKRENFGKRDFRLHIAIAPTKNIDRIEWFLEKCTEIGIDEVTLLSTAHTERKIVKDERLEKVVVSAMKQSLKAYLPRLNPLTDFNKFIRSCGESRKLIAHCNDGEKKRLDEACKMGDDVVILIGPEGDFSVEEVAFAEGAGFVPVTLGNSRLRTETAGIVACHSINFINKV